MEQLTKIPTPIEEELSRLRREGEERAAQRLAISLGFTYLDVSKAPASFEAVTAIPEEKAKAAIAVGIQKNDESFAVAVQNPKLKVAGELIKELEGRFKTVKVFIASKSGIEQIWHLYTFAAKQTSDITGRVEFEARLAGLMKALKGFRSAQSAFAALDFSKMTTSEILEMLLGGALANGVSDIHCEAEEKNAKFRYRVDGRLHDLTSGVPYKNYNSLLSRIKLLSGLKMNVRNEPQDGRFTIKIPDGSEIEIRVSIVPSEFGETVVMRVLDPKAINVEFRELGLRDDDLAIVEAELNRPNGLILNTGPTGSGKTTTLYGFLRKLNNPESKIITVEDPIEYRIEGIEQTQVDPEAGYTFAGGLRAIVRQDPDIILVGEIRDEETADIALQAALTGHLVLSTLHTNDAVGAVPRLLNLGVKPEAIGAAVSLIIAQRLVRKLCPECKKQVDIQPDLKAKLENFIKNLPPRVSKKQFENVSLFEPVGCDACNHFGFRGRVGIFEFFKGGPELEDVVLKEISETVLMKLAVKQGMVTMQQDGVLKVLLGLTSIKEIEDATGSLKW